MPAKRAKTDESSIGQAPLSWSELEKKVLAQEEKISKMKRLLEMNQTVIQANMMLKANKDRCELPDQGDLLENLSGLLMKN